MKKIAFIIINMCIVLGTINSQNIKVIYEEKIVVDSSVFNSIEVDDPQILSLIESAFRDNSANSCLYYANGKSLYEEVIIEKENISENQNIMMIFSEMMKKPVIYKNQIEKKQISQEYILDRPFIILEELVLPEWELISEEKEILNLKCKKAKIKDSEITVWYCPEIPINDGPMTFWGLPGLILEADMNGFNILAKEIDLKSDIKEKIIIPTNGKKITRDKFNDLAAKKAKEMGNSREGGGISISIDLK